MLVATLLQHAYKERKRCTQSDPHPEGQNNLEPRSLNVQKCKDLFLSHKHGDHKSSAHVVKRKCMIRG